MMNRKIQGSARQIVVRTEITGRTARGRPAESGAISNARATETAAAAGASRIEMRVA